MTRLWSPTGPLESFSAGVIITRKTVNGNVQVRTNIIFNRNKKIMFQTQCAGPGPSVRSPEDFIIASICART